MFELNDQTRWILGRPNFVCGGIARVLRAGGHEIPAKAEEEQAAVIHWMLCQWETHGSDWKAVADQALRVMAQSAAQGKTDE